MNVKQNFNIFIAAPLKPIKEDIKNGLKPIMVVGTAGDVSTGVVDDLAGIASICKKHDLWFHVDGAYGVPAAVVPEYNKLFDGLKEADSIALDPHKWLYSPLEAGCTLVKNPQHLINTYSTLPEYYNFDPDDEYLQAIYDVLKNIIPGFDNLIQDGEVTSSGANLSMGFGLRYVVQIGYRF